MDFDLTGENSDYMFYSLLYCSVTIVFATAVLTKFLTNEIRFGFRSFLSLVTLFLGEPLCQFLVKGPHGVGTFAFACMLVYWILPASRLPAKDKAVLITGCDSGFGFAIAQKLDSIGMKVLAGCLDQCGKGATKLKSSCSERLVVLKLDVTNHSDIENAKSYAQELLGEDGLWGLVNNAGISYFAETEMTSEEIFQKTINVNLFGTIRLTKAFLPLIRKSKGRIINMASFVARIPINGTSAYSVSKSAIVAFSDILRLEMKKWDVHVSIIEPLGFQTNNFNEQVLESRLQEIWDSLDKECQLVYGKRYLEDLYKSYKELLPKIPTDLSPVVQAVSGALLSKNPRERYPCSQGADILTSIYSILPIRLADKISKLVSVIPKNSRPVALEPSSHLVP